MEIKELQPRKALSPICVMESGMEMKVKLLQTQKA